MPDAPRRPLRKGVIGALAGLPSWMQRGIGAAALGGAAYTGVQAALWRHRNNQYAEYADRFNAAEKGRDIQQMGPSAFLHISPLETLKHITDLVTDPTAIGKRPSHEAIYRQLFRGAVLNREHSIITNSIGAVIGNDVGEADHVVARAHGDQTGGTNYHSHPVDVPASAGDVANARTHASGRYEVVGFGQRSDGSVVQHATTYDAKTRTAAYDHTDQPGHFAMDNMHDAPAASGSGGYNASQHPRHGKGRAGGEFMHKAFDAEEHPRDGSGRFAAAATAGAAAAATLAIGASIPAGVRAALAAHAQRAADVSTVQAGEKHVAGAVRAKAARLDRHMQAEAKVHAGLAPTGGKRFLATAPRTMRSQLRRTDNTVRAYFDRTAVTHRYTDDGPAGFVEERLSLDPDTMAELHADRQRLSDRLADLQQRGRPSERRTTQATEAHAVAGYTQRRRAGTTPVWEKHAHDKLAHLRSALGMDAPTPATAAAVPDLPVAAGAAATPVEGNRFGHLPQSDADPRAAAHQAWWRDLHDRGRELPAADQLAMSAMSAKQKDAFLARKLKSPEPPKPPAIRRATKVERTDAEKEAIRARNAQREAEALAAKRAKMSPKQLAQHDKVLAARAAKEAVSSRAPDPLEIYRATVGDALSPRWEEFEGGHASPDAIRRVAGQVGSLDDLPKLTRGMPARERKAFLEAHLLPTFTEAPAWRDVEVAPVPARTRAGGTHTVQGYPDPAARKALSAELRGDVAGRAGSWRRIEEKAAPYRVLTARTEARARSWQAAERLAALAARPRLSHLVDRAPALASMAARIGLIGGTRTRVAVLGGAAALAGAGGWLAARGIANALGKAFDPAQPRDSYGRFAEAGAARASFARAGDPPRVSMLIGMPGSGKTTWRALRMAQDAVRPTTILSTDEKVEDIARQHGLSFSEAFKLLDHREVDRAHRIALRAAVNAGHDVVIDRVNASPAGRAKWLRRVPKHYERHAVMFPVPERDLRIRRSHRAGKVIPEHALAEMRVAYKSPQPGEFTHVHRIRPSTMHVSTGVYGNTHNMRKMRPDSYSDNALRKAARESDATRHPQAVADEAEGTMARRLAAMFGTWTDGAEAKLLSPSATSLHADMRAHLDHALQPLDAAVRAGAAVPVLVGDASDPKAKVAFSFLGRSPRVTEFVDRYRQDKIAELADEQREAIKGQLLQAAKEGASPDAMARRIKETIGLTAHQMTHVANYRAELEANHHGALVRQLRDRRFDRTVQGAIDKGNPLSPAKINQVVDAYHRRYLAYRATTIARTEGVGGASNGQAAAAAMLLEAHPGFTVEKTWMATIDGRERDDHHALNGTRVIGMDTPFVCESGDEIRWPHDPTAPARQVINCRCSFVCRLVPVTTADDPDTDPNGQD